MAGLSNGNGLSASNGLSVATVGLWSGISGYSNGGGVTPGGVQLTNDAGNLKLTNDSGSAILTEA